MEKLILPKGFKSAGLFAGIKKSGARDMAMIVSALPAKAAGTFTTNQVQAAPVKLCKKHIENGTGRAIVMNSGVANACTGHKGMEAAEKMAMLTAKRIDCSPEDIFVCSTGSIGPQLPMLAIENGIGLLYEALGHDNGNETAEAMMTTDTRPKSIAIDFELGGKPCRMVGFAKGAGMIEPNMATMLSYIITDVAVDQPSLQRALSGAVNRSFNRISVDGDKSTNDTVLVLANGMALNDPIDSESAEWSRFEKLLNDVCFDLAMKIINDGEGITRTVTINVRGAASDEDADIAARSVANSMLNKTAWAGSRPNWGRVMDALGYSRATVDESTVTIYYDETLCVVNGTAADTPNEELVRIVSKPHFDINIDLGIGQGHAVVYSCNCTEEYVRINVD
jgi:glutamate N-acetyltransferase/amino-acid N-acetyltransferase